MTSPVPTRCHLVDHPARLGDLRLVDDLYEDSHYAVAIMRCSECELLYAHCYVEVFDDSWSFYASIADDEAVSLRQDYDIVSELIVSRPHIVWGPSWKDAPNPYWDEGDETALTMGPRPW